ncbi:MAG TPA: GTP-binding protein [Anaerolineaceae bacterium]|nr:GTP-binding protein [Anaerolineaceae bacterium]
MQLHIVGGFLGSGKTTAIITAARHLIGAGKKVGVVTNDRGRHLVDTAFFQNSQIHTVEIAQGCFRCSFDELEEKLANLEATEQPDVVFAESVGSCSDLVATVIQPLLDLEGGQTPPASFTVFTDSQLLLAYLQGIELPFSESVVYIFEKQIEEAGLLILNKADLLRADEIAEIIRRAAQAYPDKTIKLQNSTQTADVAAWLELLDHHPNRLAQRPIAIDYRRYGAGERRLAWLDQELSLQSTEVGLEAVVEKIIRAIQQGLAERRATIGHLKFLITPPAGPSLKISLPTILPAGWEREVRGLGGSEAKLLINARVELPAAELRRLVEEALRAAAGPGVKIESLHDDAFHPGAPTPPHRLAG